MLHLVNTQILFVLSVGTTTQVVMFKLMSFIKLCLYKLVVIHKVDHG